jgi:UDP-glucose 4-epimerase
MEQIEKLEQLTGVKVKFYFADMINIDTIEKVFNENNISHVIHFAGLKAVAESISKPLEYYSHNLQGTPW